MRTAHDRATTAARCTHIALSALLLLAAGVSPVSVRAQGPDRDAAPVAAPVAAPDPGAELEAARGALFRHELEQGERLLLRVLAATPSPAQAAEAHRRLGHLAWYIRGDAATARHHLELALRYQQDRTESLVELSRLERGERRFDAAWHTAVAAVAAAESPADSTRAVVELARVATSQAAVSPRTSPERLSRARAELAPLVADRRGLLDPAEQLLLVGLLLDDGDTALDGWLSYYASIGDLAGPIPGARRTLTGLLPGWAGSTTPRPTRIAAIQALAASGMLQAARLLALDPRLPGDLDPVTEPAVADIVAYVEFIDQAREMTVDYYRATAAGHGEQWPFRDAMVAAGRDLLTRLGWPAAGPPAADESPWGMEVWDALRERFGAEVSFGNVAGTFGVRIAHRVIDDRRAVEQYGHRADFRFVALDRVVIGDYQTWAWDGRAMTGGYATPELVVQLRPGYAGGGIRAWETLQQPDTTTIGDLIPGEGDHTRCGYVPGLAERLRRQGLEQLRDSLASDGLTDAQLRAAFLAAYEEVEAGSSIYAHEGRHAIDGLRGIEDSEELEYGAKLAQVVFARFPRLAMTSIISRDIGDPTPHGQANQRVLCGVVDWMNAGIHELDVDPDRPLLPQIHRLTDHQIRQAFRSLDPLAGDPAT